MKEQSYKTYHLYIAMMTVTFIIITLWIALFMYLLWPGLCQFGFSVALGIECTILILPVIIWSLYGILLIAVYGIYRVPPYLLRMSNRFVYACSTISLGIAWLCRISKDEFRQSMIDMINHLVASHMYTVEARQILLLTPHCLQESTCVHKVTHDIHNCKQCGRCQVGDLLEIANDYGCQFIVVTGGTLARMQVKKIKPKAIVAIACERVLASGMVDVFPIPVIGVLNERPNGPCCNTRVDVKKVRRIVEGLIDGRKSSYYK